MSSPQPPSPQPIPNDTRVRIVQLLCGPKRHAIIGLPYFPGIAAQGADDNDMLLTEATATGYVKGVIDGWLASRPPTLNPWCGICGARAETSWFYEDKATGFRTMEEAMPYLAQNALEQMKARMFLGDIGQRNN